MTKVLPLLTPGFVGRMRSGRLLKNVVMQVRRVLDSGTVIYLTGISGGKPYSHVVGEIRVHPSASLLQVKCDGVWTSVWYSEKLTDEYGVCYFSMESYDELDEEALDDTIVHFINEYGILPWCKAA